MERLEYCYECNKDVNQTIKTEKNKKYEEDLKLALEKAENEDIIALFKEISKLPGVASFLSIA